MSESLKKLCRETGTAEKDWTEIDGPETGVGVERWFRHSDGREAYACDDNGHITIEVNEQDQNPAPIQRSY